MSKESTKKYSSNKEECTICVNEVSNRKLIQCPFCNISICDECVKTFLMGIDDINPRCMSCKKVWTLEFLSEKFNTKFHNEEYRLRRAEITLQREKSLLPATQQAASIEKNLREYKDFRSKSSDENSIIFFNIYNNNCKILNSTEYKAYEKKKLKLLKLLNPRKSATEESILNIFLSFCIKKKDISEYITDILDENAMLNAMRNISFRKEKKLKQKIEKPLETQVKAAFIRRCPRQECKGFLSTQLKCGICENYACKDCRESKKSKYDEEHKCNPETIETIKLLASDTKPCPSCATQIFKIEGCDQMYCTQCNTAFSWLKGTIETGVIHNPHFYAFQRQQNGGVAPRVPGDINMCGVGNGLDDWKLVEILNTRVADMKVDLLEIHMLVQHIRAVEFYKYINTERTHFSNENLRVKYLLGDFEEKEWLKAIKIGMKKAEKNTEINKVLTMFCNTVTFTLGNMLSKYEKHSWNKKAFELENIHEEVESLYCLRTYTNNVLTKIGNRFKNVNPYITKDWGFSHNSKRT